MKTIIGHIFQKIQNIPWSMNALSGYCNNRVYIWKFQIHGVYLEEDGGYNWQAKLGVRNAYASKKTSSKSWIFRITTKWPLLLRHSHNLFEILDYFSQHW